ncbi:YybH family protein [Sediminibacterium soli]|uniref:YybH family protein n=1 Tax=Sediminibacterium soli TaxID=2698829 RepID=UPI00137B08A6|nr:nuclear transport factor 2 family protein [Sediminibacterium soli]NCI47586.1 nuclear transport factor 2 family protein [Sediminibacterium soli]
MKPIAFVCFLFAGLLSAAAQDKDEQTIRQLLHTQTIEWNKGNIEAFMQTYWKNDSLVFVGKRGLTYGYNATLENYRKSYPDAAAMGKLSFHILKVQRLAPDAYFVIGKWMLTRTIGNLDGHYTLLLKKIRGQWVIVADHSS